MSAMQSVYVPSDMTGNPTVIAAQAANELLGYSRHSCIICDDEYENQIYISARSIDEVNVQTIMEKLGGGGHMNVAGASFAMSHLERPEVC